MKDYLIEESVLFISILKWVAMATLIGGIVGLSTTLFLKALDGILALAAGWPHTFYLLPAGMAVSALVIHRLHDAGGYGIEKVIGAVHTQGGRIGTAVVPVKLAATILTIATGGSAGQVGPCGQIGAALSSFVADRFGLDDVDRKKIVVCGLSAGFAAVLGAPFAASIFGGEVLYVGSLRYAVLLPSFIAGITSYQVSSLMGIHYRYYPVDFVPALTELFVLKIVLAGLFFGLCSVALIGIFRTGERVSGRWTGSPLLKALVSGALLVGMTLLFSKQLLGSGLETIQAALRGDEILFYLFFMKAVFTSITLNFGGSGGVIMPILFVGATAGSLFGDIIGVDRATFAAVGFVSVLAGAANTPIAASILAVEFFGSAIAPFAAIASIVSFLMTGHRGIFTTQILSFRKSASMEVEVGEDLEHVHTKFKRRERSLIVTLLRGIAKAGDALDRLGRNRR